MSNRLSIHLKDGSTADWYDKFSNYVWEKRNSQADTPLTWSEMFDLSLFYEHHATRQDDCVIFESENDKTLFLLKWS